MTDIVYLTALELAGKIRSREVSSVEATRAFIDRIEAHDGDINAVIVRTFDRAVEDAEAADAAIAAGTAAADQPLFGVPMTIKESYVMAGTPATWGIPAFRDTVATSDGLAVQRFRDAGAHFLGKTNVPIDLGDFQSYNEIYGTTGNPWDTSRTPGGSSGGSSAALAAGFSALEAGSDIGGSIRNPAHFCGVFGHKPTWGIVPMQGHELMPGVPDADLSVCGPLARSAEDLAVALDIMSGPAGRVQTGWQLDLPAPRFETLRGLRVAIWSSDDLAPVSTDMANRVDEIAGVLRQAGAVVDETARPTFDPGKSHAVYQSLLTAVMSSAQPPDGLAEVQRLVAELDPEDNSVAAINLRATVMLHRDWIRHNFRRERLRAAWDEFFDEWDILVCPQMLTTAFPHDHRPFDERTVAVDGVERPYFEQLFWAGLITVAYLPSTVFPTGPAPDGLPIGLQAVGAPYRDRETIEFARLLCRETGGFVPPPGLA